MASSLLARISSFAKAKQMKIKRHIVAVVSFVIVFTFCTSRVAALRCYACPETRSVSGVVGANLECLATGSEVTCEPDEDRCYSRTGGALGDEVDKGCTRSPQCLESTVCCSQDFCNAGHTPQRRTGHSKQCDSVADCVQQDDDMVCVTSSPGDVRRCTCTPTRFQRGAVCQRKSYEGEGCHRDDQCLLTLAFCEQAMCRCPDQFFPNATQCQLKVPLGAACASDDHCRPAHALCEAEVCTCQFGFAIGPTGDVCSGQVMQDPGVWVAMSLLVLACHLLV